MSEQYLNDAEIAIAFSDRWGNDRAKALKLLTLTLDMLDRVGVQSIAMAGTLLGVHRYGTFMPFDDDVDLLTLDITAKELEKRLLSLNSHMHIHVSNEENIVKVCERNYGCGKYPWSFPFVDLAITRKCPTTGDFIHAGNLHKEQRFTQTQVAPIRRVRFANAIEIPVPNDIVKTLTNDFTEKCLVSAKSPFYNHRTETFIPPEEFPNRRASLDDISRVCGYPLIKHETQIPPTP